MIATTKHIVPLGHPQHRPIAEETARLREAAAELEVDPLELAVQVLLNYKTACTRPGR